MINDHKIALLKKKIQECIILQGGIIFQAGFMGAVLLAWITVYLSLSQEAVSPSPMPIA